MTRQPRTIGVLLWIFFMVGLGLAAGGVAALARTRSFLATAERAEGVVTGLHWSHSSKGGRTAAPIVQFSVEDRIVEFRGGISSSPPSYEEGERVPVLYTPGDPESAEIDGVVEQYLLATILSGMGSIFAAIPGTILFIRHRRARRRARARAFGQPTEARVSRVFLDRSVRVNGASPWVIEAEVPDELTGETRTLASQHLWGNFAPVHLVGSKITVYIVPGEPDAYDFELGGTTEST